MKILVVIPAIGNVYGGPSKSVIELNQAIGVTGIDVDIVTTNANGSDSIDVPLNCWIEKNNYRIQYFPYWGIKDYKITFSLTRWLWQNVRNYDLVHTNAIFSYAILPAYFACRKYNIPYIITPRGMLEPWALSYKAWKKKIYYNLFEKPALDRASAIQMLASSEAQRSQPLNLKSPQVIIPNGIHRQDFEPIEDPDLFYQKFPSTRNKQLIIFLGRIDPKKGLDLLAEAMGKVHHKFPQAHLIVAGSDNIDFLSQVKQYFTDAGCLDKVTFTGLLTGSLKYSALAAADVYVAPSYSEGFSMSVLEGMASGLPCIITTGCNFPEAKQNGTAYVTDINSQAIAIALEKCLSQPEDAEIMGKRARDFIFSNYTWDQIALKMVKVYQEVIQRPISKTV